MEHHYRLMERALPLLIKIAAAAAAGTAALFAFHRQRRSSAIASLRRSIVRALLHLPARGTPPAILVLGFCGDGKSAFIDTAFRALGGEEGLMVLHSETPPAGSSLAMEKQRAVEVANAGCCCCCCCRVDEKVLSSDGVAVQFIDALPLPEPATVTADDIEAAVEIAADCVVVVLSCRRPKRRRQLAVRRLTEIAAAVRNRGLELLVVLTHRRFLRDCKQAEELRSKVASRARTDCVYFTENCTHCADFRAQCAALEIVRQCVEFASQRRRQPATRKTIHSSMRGRENLDCNEDG